MSILKEPIKSCPFCGSAGELIQEAFHTYYVCCRNNDCKVIPMTTFQNSPQEAVMVWNTRFE